MSKEKQILQMLQDGYSQRRIASTLRISRNTVAKVVNAASDHQLPKGALDSMEEAEIHHALFPEEAFRQVSTYSCHKSFKVTPLFSNSLWM